MYEAKTESIDSLTKRHRFTSAGAPMSIGQVIEGWRNDIEFCDWFCSLLRSCQFETFRWETPPLTSRSVDHEFECVLVDSPGLAPRADRGPFQGHFDAAAPSQTVISFANLRGDSTLVVPVPESDTSDFRHLAAFSRTAPVEQQRVLWRTVGQQAANSIGGQPVWMSTAGGGVSWLHVRFDSRPKYYQHRPYKSA